MHGPSSRSRPTRRHDDLLDDLSGHELRSRRSIPVAVRDTVAPIDRTRCGRDATSVLRGWESALRAHARRRRGRPRRRQSVIDAFDSRWSSIDARHVLDAGGSGSSGLRDRRRRERRGAVAPRAPTLGRARSSPTRRRMLLVERGGWNRLMRSSTCRPSPIVQAGGDPVFGAVTRSTGVECELERRNTIRPAHDRAASTEPAVRLRRVLRRATRVAPAAVPLAIDAESEEALGRERDGKPVWPLNVRGQYVLAFDAFGCPDGSFRACARTQAAVSTLRTLTAGVSGGALRRHRRKLGERRPPHSFFYGHLRGNGAVTARGW